MTAVSSAYYRTRRALLTLMSSGDAQQGRQWQTNTIDQVTDDKVTLKTNYTGEGGSHHFKPVILDSTACIYEHEDLFPKLQNKRDCYQCHEETHLGIGIFSTSAAVLITYDKTP